MDAFEKEFASFLGVKYALGVTSGTAALHTALAALGVGPGQEIIIPAYPWSSVAAAVIHLGAIPVLADIDDTFCMDAQSAETKITSRTSGIIVAHMNAEWRICLLYWISHGSAACFFWKIVRNAWAAAWMASRAAASATLVPSAFKVVKI